MRAYLIAAAQLHRHTSTICAHLLILFGSKVAIVTPLLSTAAEAAIFVPIVTVVLRSRRDAEPMITRT